VKLDGPPGQSYLRWSESLQESRVNPIIDELAPDTKLGAFLKVAAPLVKVQLRGAGCGFLTHQCPRPELLGWAAW
jgi:hypothetical protein